MTTMPAPTLRDVRRGVEPDELELTTTDGTVLILHAHGVHVDERRRTREAVLQLLVQAFGAEEGRV